MSIVGYHKTENYIITIETEKYNSYMKEIKNAECALYETKSFIVIDIEDLCGTHYDSIFDFVIESIYNYTNITLEFFKIKNVAFNLDFIFKQQWKYFPSGFAGFYTEYLSDGTKLIEYYHINGIKNGEYKYYWPNEQIHELFHYVNNIQNGDFTSYYTNGTIKSKGLYINNHLKGDYYEYDYMGNISKHEYK